MGGGVIEGWVVKLGNGLRHGDGDAAWDETS